MNINLGCGADYRTGWLNCDRSKNVKADKVFDFEQFPYPLESESADQIHALQVFEHLDHVPEVLNECHRILKPNGLLHIEVPYGKSDWALQDVTHKRYYTERSFVPFCTAGNFYSTLKWRMVKARLTTDSTTLRHRIRNCIPFRQHLRYFFFNMYDGITFEMTALK